MPLRSVTTAEDWGKYSGEGVTLALHWDETYRDRCDPGTYWDGEWDNDRLASAYKIAKHIEPKEEAAK